MIRIANVSKKIRFKHILSNCKAKIDKGKIIGIIGENGCGKTTILKIIAGIMQPSSGSVKISNINDMSNVMAYCHDSDYFYPYFTIKQLIDYYQSQYSDFDIEKANRLIEFFHLNENEKIKYLSKGQLGRVKITVTLARKAPLLMLDEPLSGLDPLVKQKIVKGIIEYVDLDNQTILLTTHELLEVEPLLDEVIVMREGTIVTQREVEDIRITEGKGLNHWLEEIYL
ncbi:ABC transporter ATP-binding protein [Gracilibacillus oryzae]|uniref:ABC transporter ATP-binding protein n=1 Tax=Gracilibacillus oryzae TaxID=1672701 RepID=A0A7C8GSD1_9BACI|nr:ABC transporter ATP-binding protein [Gracilibacillus oryzae]KAB8131312.1 ABC transporter ATP-binding protein [Gracilibacillus oryzae]